MMLCAPWLDLENQDDHRYLCCEPTDYGDGQMELAVLAASTLLYPASGRQYPGECTTTIRPCELGGPVVQWVAYSYSGGSRPLVAVGGGSWCGCNGDGIGCLANGIVLPGNPVVAVDEVKVNGEVLASSDYRLSGRTLLRRDGSWPCHQDLSREDTEERTFAITYRYGQRPDAGGLFAVGALACEIASACGGDGDCSLPEPIANLVRENVTLTVEQAEPFGATGMRFGLEAVDRWLEAVNPAGLDRPGKFFGLATIGPLHQ